MNNTLYYYTDEFSRGFGRGAEMPNITVNIGSGELAALAGLGVGLMVISLILFLALLGLKMWAVYTAAKRHEKWWFSFLFILNTCGILEIIYLVWVAKVFAKEETCAECGEKVDHKHKKHEKEEK